MDLVFGIAGAAVGSFIPGVGASLGWSIGSFLGGQFAGSEDKVLDPKEGPRLGDLKVTTSTYGNMIPIAYGVVRVAGNFIFAPDIDETATTTVVSSEAGGKGGGGGGGSTSQQQTTYSYSADFAIGIVAAPTNGLGIGGIRKTWANGKLIYDVGEDSEPLNVLASTAAMTVYTGEETQTIDPTMEAVNPTLTPAYRGLAYAMFNDLALAPFGNRHPNLDFEVVMDGTLDVMVPTELYTLPSPNAWSNSTGTGDVNQVRLNTANAAYFWTVQNVTLGSPTSTLATLALYDNFSGQQLLTVPTTTGHLTLCGEGFNGRMWYQEHNIGASSSTLNTVSRTGEVIIQLPDGHGVSDADNRLEKVIECPDVSPDPENNPVFYLQYNHPTASVVQVLRFQDDLDTEVVAGVGSGGITEFLDSAERIAGRIYIGAYATSMGTIGYVETDDEQAIFHAIRTYNQSTKPWGMVGIDGYIYARSMDLNDANILEKLDPDDGSIVDTLTLTGLSDDAYGTNTHFVQDAAGRLYVQVDRNLWRVNYGTMELDATATLTNADDWILPGDTVQGLGVLVIRVEPTGSPAAPNNVVRVLMDPLTPNYPLLSEVVSDICVRCGLSVTDIDVAGLASDTVAGYVIGRRGTGKSFLEPLMGTYFFDAVESDNKIKFVKRGGVLATTIVEDDLAAHTGRPDELPDQLKVTRKQELELPVECNLAYMDKTIDYQISQQSSRRLITSSKTTATLSVPIVLTADEAKQKIDTIMFNAWVERDSYEWTTSRAFAVYEPTDIVAIVKNGITHSVRITQKDEGADGIIRWQGVADATYIYTQTSVGVPPEAGPEEIVVIGPTDVLFLDIPMLRDQDDIPGFYVVARGAADGWRGAQLYESRDQGTTYQATDGTVYAEGDIGYATTALGTYPDTDRNEIFDERNFVTVFMLEGSLASASRADVLDGANAAVIGDEVIQFRTATLVDTDTYTLSGLLRGRLGSESFMNDHIANERFVLLTDSLRNITQLLADRNRAIPYKMVSFGATVDQAAPSLMVNTDRRLKPLAPWHVRAGKIDTDWTIEWTARSRRRGSGWTVLPDDTTEEYEVDILAEGSPNTILRTLEVSGTSTTTYTLAQQTEDYGAETDVLNLVVYKMSDRVGRGYPSQQLRAIDDQVSFHNYWRITTVDVSAGGTFLEISELQFFENGVLVNSSATWTTSTTPDIFSLPSLVDNDTGTRSGWTTANAEAVGFWVKADFSATGPRKIDGVKQGGWDTSNRYMAGFTLEFSDDNVNWTVRGSQSALTYPGNNTLSSLYTF